MSKEIYQLRITFTDAGNRREGMPYRVVEFRKESNLQLLAEFILKCYNMKMTEPFGFYSDLVNWHKSEHKFELFEDDPKANTIKKTLIEDVLPLQKTFLFIYDYLEEYRFLIDMEKEVPARKIITYPELIETVGETPAQSNDNDFRLDDDEDDRYGVTGGKKGAGFRSEDDDLDDDDYNKGKSGGFDDDDEPFDDPDGGDDYGFDEFGKGGHDDRYDD